MSRRSVSHRGMSCGGVRHAGVTCHVLLWLTAWLWLVTPLFSQEKPITIETSTMQPSVVLGRPMLTWWDVKIPGSNLVVGKFRFVIKSEGYHFATVETEELTINGPEQRIRVMLPAVDCPQWIDRLYVDISFSGKKYTGDLGQQILRVPFASKTVFFGLVGESRLVRRRSPQRDKILDVLRFERLIPDLESRVIDDNDNSYVKTIFASIDPADFPTDALGYCGYDVIILMKDEFRNLRKPQLEGLLAWIKAGGSLYVEPNGVLEAYHVDFLKDLVADLPHPIVIQLDQFGKLAEDTIPAEQPAAAVKCGLGDAVIRTADPDSPLTLTEKNQRKIIGALWKSRRYAADPQSRGNTINIMPQMRQFQFPVSESDPYGFGTAHANRLSLKSGDLLDRLMPESIRMVPLSVLAAILIGFVILIGPGDYFGLGWLRARKLTWITFPAATICVTGLTVWLSNYYMTVAETRRSLVVRDLSPKGEVVRTNEFELLFVASTKAVPTPVEKCLFTKLESGSSLAQFGVIYAPGQNPWAPGGIRYGNNMPLSKVVVVNPIEGTSSLTAIEIQGRIPGQFTATQNLSKWTPQVNRLMSIPGSAASPQIDWSEWDLGEYDKETIRKNAVPPKLVNATRTRFGPEAMVACLTGKDGWALDRAPGWRSNRVINQQLQQPMYQRYEGLQHGPMHEADLFRWLYQASVPPTEQGAFALTRQTTPKGGAICDDLALLDPSDPDMWLLLVVVPEKEDLVVYRKLMRFR